MSENTFNGIRLAENDRTTTSVKKVPNGEHRQSNNTNKNNIGNNNNTSTARPMNRHTPRTHAKHHNNITSYTSYAHSLTHTYTPYDDTITPVSLLMPTST
eukprot:PhM_4_TR18471/c1_g3_i2/m.21139